MCFIVYSIIFQIVNELLFYRRFDNAQGRTLAREKNEHYLVPQCLFTVKNCQMELISE